MIIRHGIEDIGGAARADAVSSLGKFTAAGLDSARIHPGILLSLEIERQGPDPAEVVRRLHRRPALYPGVPQVVGVRYEGIVESVIILVIVLIVVLGHPVVIDPGFNIEGVRWGVIGAELELAAVVVGDPAESGPAARKDRSCC